LQWPFAAYTLSKKFNPDGYVIACRHFLDLPDHMLDTGFGLPLRRLVCMASEIEMLRVQYLMSDAVQNALDLASESAAASSLPVERAFAQTKRSEAPRLCHVATASRNHILRQYLRELQENLQEVSAAAAALRKSLYTNVARLAWELQPQLADLALQHSTAAMRQTMVQHHEVLHVEVSRRRQVARDTVQRLDQGEVQLTKADWISWFRRHQDQFCQSMQSAPSARKSANRRLCAAEGLPSPASRLLPCKAATPGVASTTWKPLLAGRSGWHASLAAAVARSSRFVCGHVQGRDALL